MILHPKVRESRSPPGHLNQTQQTHAGWSSPVARQAHNLKVTGSNPVPATTNIQATQWSIAVNRAQTRDAYIIPNSSDSARILSISAIIVANSPRMMARKLYYTFGSGVSVTLSASDSEEGIQVQALARTRVRRRTWVMSVQASELWMVASTSLASLRHRPAHAKVRSTTHRLGKVPKPFAVPDRLMICTVQRPYWPRRPSARRPRSRHRQRCAATRDKAGV